MKEYSKRFYTRVSVVLHKIHDRDIIEYLETMKSKSDYIKRLIREDIADPAAGGDQANARADHTETDPDTGNTADDRPDPEE